AIACGTSQTKAPSMRTGAEAAWPGRARPCDVPTTMRRLPSLRQDGEGPDRAALRHRVLELVARDVPIETADARQHRDVLLAVVGIGDGLRVDAGAGLELPDLLAVLDVERDEFAGLLTGEQQPAAGDEVGRPDRMVGQRHAPLLFAGERIDRVDVAPRLATVIGYRQALDIHVALADHERLGLEVFVERALVLGVGVKHAGLRAVGGMGPVLGAQRRGPQLDLLSTLAQRLGEIGLDRPAGLLV